MPDQNEMMEYKKKVTALDLADLKDILAHINRDKVPWKYDIVKAEIEAKESGKAAPEPVFKDEPKADVTKDVSGNKEAVQPQKPAFQLRRSRLGQEGAKPTPAPAATPTPKPAPKPAAPKPEEKVIPAVEKPPVIPAAAEPVKVTEIKPQPEPVTVVKETVVPAAVAKKTEEKPAIAPVDFALLGLSIVFLLLAIYIVAVPFVNLPGGEAMKSLLNKIPLF